MKACDLAHVYCTKEDIITGVKLASELPTPKPESDAERKDVVV